MRFTEKTRNCLFRGCLSFAAAMMAASCASSSFYDEVDGTGEIRGTPRIDWVKPDKFVYLRDKNSDFAFIRSNGEVIIPGSIETDGGSIPRALWNNEGFTPWTYAPAYLIHDWLYEAHRRGEPAGVSQDGTPLYYSKEQADWIMAEIIKTQMERPDLYETEKSPRNLKGIHWAVHHFGQTAWEKKPQPVNELLIKPVDSAIEYLPFRPVLKTLQDELIPSPSAPPMAGTAVKQP